MADRSARIAAGLACLSLALLPGLTGCGSGNTGDESGPLTREAFKSRANTICNRVNDELRQAMVETFPPDRKPDNETGIRFTHEIWVPTLREQNRKLRELEPPAADRQKIDRMLTELERATDRVDADPALASQGPFDRVTRQLTAYGIGPCGSP